MDWYLIITIVSHLAVLISAIHLVLDLRQAGGKVLSGPVRADAPGG